MGKPRGDIREKIFCLREEGLTYDEIASIVCCNKGTVCYHLNSTQKQKSQERQIRSRQKNHISGRIFCFKKPYQAKNRKGFLQNIRQKTRKFKTRGGEAVSNYDYGYKEVLEKLGDSPKCYLTGVPIDLSKSSTYSFDHIIPRSRGGNNSLENLGLCLREVNNAKSDMTPEEFISLCKKIVDYNNNQST